MKQLVEKWKIWLLVWLPMFDHLLLLFPQKIVYFLPKVIMVITAEKDKVYLSEKFCKNIYI